MQKPNVVNHPINPRIVRLAEAFFDMEDGLGIAYRKSLLASAMFEELRNDALDELRISVRNPELPRDWAIVLRKISGKFEALCDALTDLTCAVNELDRAYYAADNGEAA